MVTLSELSADVDTDPVVEVEFVSEVDAIFVGDSIELSLVAMTPVRYVDDDNGSSVEDSMLTNELLDAAAPVSLNAEDTIDPVSVADDDTPVPTEIVDSLRKKVDEDT